ncbi:MAG: PfkB domain protein [Candidatus Roizmanbacteria bacterium GW2011_GWA2_34_18]|uniref:PfkB domain protein n=1 Tax=Candidatus Roizmanbacteria bacterium GW2011_GWA2_34_18 TaxID=1618477 RepID=A0A0G0AQS1_9BACT|nr:MAG: PfkB domain protein [Candidatus Roizmanbacteria bacterium GW2011_GWA2_34_18]
MNTYKTVYVTGSIAYDTIMDFPGEFKEHFHLEKLHQINVSFVVDKLEKQLGGTGTNIGYNISKIINNKSQITNKYQISNNKIKTKQRITLLGSVGKDGKEFVKFFKKNKIDVSGVIVDKKLYTASGSVITDIKNNQIWGFYYGASEKIPYIDFKKINRETDLLVISANHQNSFLYFQKEAIKHKIPYLYDPGMTLTWIIDKDLKEGVMNCRYLVGNDYEIAMITKRIKKTIKELTNCGLKIITTLGEEGVRYEEKSKIIKIPAYKVKKMIDPTGAGDAWRGGFVAGLLFGYSTEDCLKLGNVMASFAIEKYGTVNHRPTKKEIEKRLEKITNIK